MSKKKVLIVVTTYPLPSRSYDELVCTAGVLEDGTWIRIYPVPFKFLSGLRNDGIVETYKFTWIELELERRKDDFRPESYSPLNRNFSDINILDGISVKGGKKARHASWLKRKELCTKNVYTDLTQLVADSQDPTNVSLATFKPTRFIGFDHEEDEREWKSEWQEQLKQYDMFYTPKKNGVPRKLIKKIPYKFFYRFEDCNGRKARLMIEDWEIGQLFFNCLAIHKDELIAVQKVKEQYWDNFMLRDIYLFLGTTQQWHRRRSTNPFVITGVFYPPHLAEEVLPVCNQLSLFASL
ncbi:hypothetical protein IWX76_002876 [Pedobacter sp. CAN_A7]|uniref:hypothetical protein n=1 Tax=Pedobacter sp. CAN_A7 TaxID=2787722 RepID=UPI0018C90B03